MVIGYLCYDPRNNGTAQAGQQMATTRFGRCLALMNSVTTDACLCYMSCPLVHCQIAFPRSNPLCMFHDASIKFSTLLAHRVFPGHCNNRRIHLAHNPSPHIHIVNSCLFGVTITENILSEMSLAEETDSVLWATNSWL